MNERQFNQEILDKLIEYEISDTDTALLYLLGVYYGLNVNSIPDDIIKRVNLTKIVVRDYSKSVKATEPAPVVWNIPLFPREAIEVDKNWKWLEIYRDMFIAINKDKGGDRKGIETRMKKFFSENPHVRASDVLKAAEIYLRPFIEGNDSKYMVQADYFISKKVDGVWTSRLSGFVEQIIKERQKAIVGGEGRFVNQIKSTNNER